MSTVDALPLARRTHVMEFIGNSIVGGMETYVQRFAERLPRERFRVTAVCPYESRFSEALRQRGAEVLVLEMPDDPGWSAAVSWGAICSAAAYINAEQVDVLHAHLSNAHLLAGVVGRLTDVPVLYTVHSRRLAAEDLEAHRLTRTHLGVVCKYTQLDATGMGASPELLHLIPNGVDLDAFHPSRPRDGLLRRDLGVPAAAPLVGFVGRLSPEKGPETFLRAMLLAHAAHPALHAVMVGTGPMLPRVRAFIKSCRMGRYVHLAGVRDDMADVLRELDVFVSSSHSEAMPLAMMEAMASGVPVIGTRVGGVSDMIRHGECGVLVDRADINAMAAAVRELLDDTALRGRMARAARERAEAQFSLAASVEATQGLLLHLAAGRSGVADAAPTAANEAIAPKLLPSKAHGRAGRNLTQMVADKSS